MRAIRAVKALRGIEEFRNGDKGDKKKGDAAASSFFLLESVLWKPYWSGNKHYQMITRSDSGSHIFWPSVMLKALKKGSILRSDTFTRRLPRE